MAFKMKNPSIAKMVKMAGNSRTMAKMKHEAAAKMKKKASMAKQETADEEVKRVTKDQQDFEKRKRAKIEKLQKEVKDKVDKYNTSMDSINTVRKNYKTQQEKDYENMSASEYRKKYPTTNKMKKDDSMAKMKKPMKMKKDDTMAKKALVGKQKNLPPELKAAIEAAPGKMKKGESMAKQGYRPTYDSKGEKIDYTDPDVLKREKEANKRIYKNRTKAKEEKGLSKFDKKEIKRLKEKSTIPPGKLKKK